MPQTFVSYITPFFSGQWVYKAVIKAIRKYFELNEKKQYEISIFVECNESSARGKVIIKINENECNRKQTIDKSNEIKQ